MWKFILYLLACLIIGSILIGFVVTGLMTFNAHYEKLGAVITFIVAIMIIASAGVGLMIVNNKTK